MNNKLALFEEKEIRKVWKDGKWYFSIIDVVYALTNSSDPKQYVKKMRARDSQLNMNWGTICTPLKMIAADGKNRRIQMSDTEGILRIIQSISSPKAEPFKLWLAKVGSDRIEEINNPELAMVRMRELYKKKGYSKVWIEQRERGIITRNNLTDEWQERGAKIGKDYAILTNEIYKSGLGEASAVEIHKKNNSIGIINLKNDMGEAGEVIKGARNTLESKLKRSIISNQNYIDLMQTEEQKIENK